MKSTDALSTAVAVDRLLEALGQLETIEGGIEHLVISATETVKLANDLHMPRLAQVHAAFGRLAYCVAVDHRGDTSV